MVPGLQEARMVQSTIKRLGIQDVELFWDAQLHMWGVYQVRKVNTGIVTLDNPDATRIEPLLMWWVKDNQGRYRAPGEQDINDVVATVHRAEYWFDKGGDALADALDEQDKKRREETDKKHSERIKPHVKALKKAIRKELG